MLKEMRFPHSLGLLYSAFTQFTGFKVNSGEYKMMGLAPYGDPKYVDTIYDKLLDLKADGSVELNLDYFAYLAEPRTTNEKFAELFGGPPRVPESRITKREVDLARSIQAVTEDAMLRMARYAHQLTGEKKLCLAGGVALNCVANGRLLREGPFEDIWIQPAAGDAGGAVGAALDAYYSYFDGPRDLDSDNGRPMQGGSYLGPSFSNDEIRSFLDTNGYPYKLVSESERADVIAKMLEQKKVVGFFSGRSEFGPRALGARSILGDARSAEMQVNLNLKIKYRESFRPFAPTVLAERASDFFELDRESPYMLLVAQVRENLRRPFELEYGDGNLLDIVKVERSNIPAVTHVDYSARVQTVRREDQPVYYDVINSFDQLTSCPVIVNTSFNVRGEPIVCTPEDAYRCFMRTEMDALVLENCILMKVDQPDWPEPKGHIETNESKEPPQKEMTDLRSALSDVYQNDFLPVAGVINQKKQGKISTQFEGKATMWSDYEAPQSPVPAVVVTDSEKTDSNAVTAFWTPGVATDLLRPVVEKLVGLDSKYPTSDPAELQERVSDFVYVLY
jgi:carbamoyltransferase